MRKWRIEDSEELYNITGWGVSYFSINEKGHVTVTPRKDGVAVDLKELVDELQLRDVTAPMLVRFPDILDNRIEKISNCFQQAADEYGYKAQNFIIYPIKVNQMRPVVEEIISHGKKFNLGLEAGSKPELHAVIAINTDSDSLIVCNGYKDESYIELALLAQKMGKRIFLVVEKLNELRLIFRIAKQLNVRPNIGIRIKLASSGSGKWEESGGDASKFGLTSSELLEALDFIEKKDMKDCLKLIHFHIGSQVTKIRRIKTALREASQFYVQLHQLGFPVEFVDIGGGSTEIAVISLGGIVSNNSIRIAGDDLTADIQEYMSRQHNVKVSERMAERININVGAALTELGEDPPEDYIVHGPNRITALPMEVPVCYQEVAHCLEKSISKIETAILSALENTPPELYADIVHNGIYLAGGGALLRGLDKRLTDKINIPFHIAEDPLLSVAKGTGIALKNVDRFSFLMR